MTSWFRETDESLRLLSEERLLVTATELVSNGIERRGFTRTALADALGVKLSEISQRLSGKRNLTLRTFASMLHALGYEADIVLRDCRGVRATSVYHGERRMNWPSPESRYSQQGGTSLRVISGGKAA